MHPILYFFSILVKTTNSKQNTANINISTTISVWLFFSNSTFSLSSVCTSCIAFLTSPTFGFVSLECVHVVFELFKCSYHCYFELSARKTFEAILTGVHYYRISPFWRRHALLDLGVVSGFVLEVERLELAH